jgi:hypothetical protein
VTSFPDFLDRKYTMEQFIEEMNQMGTQGWELAAASIPPIVKNSFPFLKEKLSKNGH